MFKKQFDPGPFNFILLDLRLLRWFESEQTRLAQTLNHNNKGHLFITQRKKGLGSFNF